MKKSIPASDKLELQKVIDLVTKTIEALGELPQEYWGNENRAYHIQMVTRELKRQREVIAELDKMGN